MYKSAELPSEQCRGDAAILAIYFHHMKSGINEKPKNNTTSMHRTHEN